MTKKFKKGFTLVELLIVIAVIGILATVVLVALNSARLKAKKATYKSSLSALSPAIALCCDIPNGRLLASSGGKNDYICSKPDPHKAADPVYPTLEELRLEGVSFVSNSGSNCTDDIPTITVTPTNLTGCTSANIRMDKAEFLGDDC